MATSAEKSLERYPNIVRQKKNLRKEIKCLLRCINRQKRVIAEYHRALDHEKYHDFANGLTLGILGTFIFFAVLTFVRALQ